MTSKLLITVPDIQMFTSRSVFVMNPINGYLEPLATHMIYVVDLYEYRNNPFLKNKKYKLIKRHKFENFQLSHDKVKELIALQEERPRHEFLMWSKSEVNADMCFKDFVKKNVQVKNYLLFDPHIFKTLQEINKSTMTTDKEAAKLIQGIEK